MKIRLLFSYSQALCASFWRDLAAEVRPDRHEVHERPVIGSDRTLPVMPSIWLAS